MPRSNFTGRRFGKLVAIEPDRSRGRLHWICECDCGQRTSVERGNLASGHTISCGCHRRAVLSVIGEKSVTHGESRVGAWTPEYRLYTSIKARCYNPNTAAYPRYGGRGIQMCKEWLASFERFVADVGRRPGPEYSLDRYPNNDGNYEPSNVRWATRQQQSLNRRSNHYLNAKGKKLTLSQWGDLTGISARIIWKRLQRGWSAEDAVSVPPKSRKPKSPGSASAPSSPQSRLPGLRPSL